MNKNDTLRPDITTSQDLSVTVLDFDTTIGRKFKLSSIVFKATGPITETITITKTSAEGATYDTVLRVIGLSAEDDAVFRPDGDEDFQAGDELNLHCTNTGGAETIKAVIKTRELE